MFAPFDRALAVGAACAALALAGCHSDRTGPAPTGTLSVAVTSTGMTPAITVSGPNGYSKSVTSSQVFTGLSIGTYTIAADSVGMRDSVVGGLIDTAHITGNPAVVASHDTVKVTIKYAFERQYGAMWVGSLDGPELDGYTGPQLHSAESPAPADTLGDAPVAGMTADANGNLWVANPTARTIRMYSPAQQTTPGDTASAIVISDASLSEPYSMAFDKQGNLWVGDVGALKAYTPTQLTAGGTQSPTILITSGALGLTPGIVFDADGDLWASNYGGSTLLKYNASQLAASGAVDPVDTLGSIASLVGPAGVQFDPHGNLWVANHSTNTIVMFTPSQLTASGSPTPPVIITTAASTGSQMWGVTFDARGWLWAVGAGSDTVMVFTAAQIAATGSPVPVVTLSDPDFAFPSFVVFNQSLSLPANFGSAARVRSSRSVRRAARPRTIPLPDAPFFRKH